MTALAHESPIASTLDDFTTRPTAFIAALPIPDGVRVEFIERNYYMAPPANAEHNRWAVDLIVQLRAAGIDAALIGNGYCSEPAGEKHVTGAFIPDFEIPYRRPNEADEAYRSSHDGWYPASMLHLVGEITSPSNARIDREEKYRTYARAGIPVYLLIDREKGLAICHSEPVDRGEESYYRVADPVKLGEKVQLPDGLPTLDTAKLN
ncbi:Uma2 family endonuclease [Embleya sp. NPDC020630]|uniref:Uma2 family endonuclease n=1 Tax=Embleya sp. NPDC020630 TaxID=3363979 RepID=UPI00378862BA